MYIYGFSEILSYLYNVLDPLNIHGQFRCNVRWIMWHYTNKTVPSLKFWQRSHESILVCYKETYIFNRDLVRESYTPNYLKSAGKKRVGTQGRFGNQDTVYNVHSNGALPRDVIKIPALAGGAGRKERVNHPTQKPLLLCETLLKACQRTTGTTGTTGTTCLVVIPFCGSGSECVAAKRLNMDVISYELNTDYVTVYKH
jgi:site-specific DNA-methyltransferase (adenine-specific)